MVVISGSFIPVVRDLISGRTFIFFFLVFFLLGGVLVFLVKKEKETSEKLKKFLTLTGVSAVSFFISGLLHNLIYGLSIRLFGQDFWVRIGLEDEPIFFFSAIIVCPVGFLIGVVGAIYCLIKETKKES